jgi:hypothetical protein
MRDEDLHCLTNERLRSAPADNDRLDRLSLAGAEGSACEGKRFHGVPDLVEEFGHGGHARKMTPKSYIIQVLFGNLKTTKSLHVI